MDKSKYDETQLGYLAQAEKLQKELIDNGFLATRVEKQKDDRITFNVIFFDGKRDYRIHRDYQGNVQVNLHNHAYFPHVSNGARRKVYEDNETNNIKAITQKKIQGKIDALNTINDTLSQLEKDAVSKANTFIQSMTEMEKRGFQVAYTRVNGEITGGQILKNGIQYSFDISGDGYISERIELHYAIDKNLSAFEALSENKYTNK